MSGEVGAAQAGRCKHGPAQHPAPFWFVDQLDDDDPDFDARWSWGIWIQLDGCVDRLQTLFYSEDDAMGFLRENILAATTVCDQ